LAMALHGFLCSSFYLVAESRSFIEPKPVQELDLQVLMCCFNRTS